MADGVTKSEWSVARSVGAAVQRGEGSFGLLLGDNFYPGGIGCTGRNIWHPANESCVPDATNWRFKASYEDPFEVWGGIHPPFEFYVLVSRTLLQSPSRLQGLLVNRLLRWLTRESALPLQLGNHDYVGNTSAQIEYAKTSKTWRFPATGGAAAPWYSFTKAFVTSSGATVTAEFFMLDTVLMVWPCCCCCCCC